MSGGGHDAPTPHDPPRGAARRIGDIYLIACTAVQGWLVLMLLGALAGTVPKGTLLGVAFVGIVAGLPALVASILAAGRAFEALDRRRFDPFEAYTGFAMYVFVALLPAVVVGLWLFADRPPPPRWDQP